MPPSKRAILLRRLLAASAQREREALRLYEPLPKAAAFHESRAMRRLLIGSNRAGKTSTSLKELAAALLGADPKYPRPPILALVVAKDEESIGTVLWKGLTDSPFPILRDQGKWRAVRPWLEEDQRRRAEWAQAEPLIPPRLIQRITWKHKGKKVPHIVTLHNGSELRFYSGMSEPPQGVKADVGVLDEEVPDRWYPEIMMRLTDRMGRFWWSATPQAGHDKLYDLDLEAEQPVAEGQQRPVEKFHMLIHENRYLTADSIKQAEAAVAGDPEAYRVRIKGEFAVIGFTIYPEFRPADEHGVTPFPIPWDWTRYIAIDFGREPCAVLFCAIPPVQAQGNPQRYEIHLYDELYLRGCDAGKLSRALKAKLAGSWVQAFMVDHRSGRQRDIASGRSIEDQIRDTFRREGVHAERSNFLWGCMDTDAREEATHAALAKQPDGDVTLKVHKGRVPTLCWEMRKYRRSKDKWGNPGRAVDKDDHLIFCLEALCHFRPPWVEPPSPGRVAAPVDRIAQLKRELAALSRTHAPQGVCLGAPSYHRSSEGSPTWP